MPRPTHFLALPLHNHSTLRTRVHNFQHALLASTITGLDPSIVIDPRRLHLTLGVMALTDVQPALDLLQSLRPGINEILLNGNRSVQVKLDTLDVLKSDPVNMKAHVLFLAPREDQRLRDVCDLVNRSFRSAGFITETRPLKLHCTILNTSHRRPRSNIPFSYSDILTSQAYRSVLAGEIETSPKPLVDFGTYDVHRVELWQMGTHGPNNEYVSCGGIDL